MKKSVKVLTICLMLVMVMALAACIAQAPEAEITGIAVNADNAKYWYFKGAEIDPTGLVITATLSDGTTKDIPPEECEFTKPSFFSYGEKSVTVSYKDFEAEYTVYTCPIASSVDQFKTYTIRKNENGSEVTLTPALVGENKPFVLIFPGGGYTDVLTRKEGYDYAAKINELGYNAFILEYSVNMEHPAPLDDVNLAYEIIEQNKDYFGVTMDNYAVCGSSAGGHLAATWSTKVVGYEHYGKPRPATAILVYAATHIFEDSRSNLVGENASPERRRSLSADENVDADYPPTYQWVFVEDDVTAHVELMEQALEAAGVTHITRYFHGGAHGLGLAEGYEAEGWLEEAITFWQDMI